MAGAWVSVDQDPDPNPPNLAPTAVWKRAPEASWDIEQVKANLKSGASPFVDARPGGRFLGTVPEPREGMRGGHVPGSVNVPFVDVLTGPPVRMMKSVDELKERFSAANVNVEELAKGETQAPVVTSCGSGMTACILGLAMHQLGIPLSRWAVYDGSWAEWGAHADTPIERQNPDGSKETVP